MTSVPECLLLAEAQRRQNQVTKSEVDDEVEDELRKRSVFLLLTFRGLGLDLRLTALVGIAHGELPSARLTQLLLPCLKVG